MTLWATQKEENKAIHDSAVLAQPQIDRPHNCL